MEGGIQLIKVSEIQLEIKDIEGACSKIISRCPKCNAVKTYIPHDYQFESSLECKCEHRERIQAKVKKYSKMSIFDKNFESNTFKISNTKTEKEEAYRKRFYNFCKKFDDFENKRVGILMSGIPGTGKTYYTNCIINELQERNKTCLCWNVSSYLRMITDSFDKDSEDKALETKLLKAVSEVDLVVLDDLGSEKLSEFAREKLYNLVNQIYMNNVKLIVSTNNNLKELANHLKFNGSDKIIDRIKEICIDFVFDWESRRGKNREEMF